MTYTFVVLGDVHFGKYSCYPAFGATTRPGTQDTYDFDVYDSLVDTLKKEEYEFDSIFVPGDLTSIASPTEFLGCKQFVEKLAIEIDVPVEGIFYTYGNHDTNWRISKLAKEEKFVPDLGYHEIAASIGNEFAPNSGLVTSGPMPGSGIAVHKSADIYILNTGYACVDSQTVPHGRIGPIQLEWIKSNLNQTPDPSRWRIVVLHHHPHNYPYPVPIQDLSQVAEGAELVQLFGTSGVDFVCHGHRHHPILRTIWEASWHHPVTYLCAGSVGVDEEHRSKGGIPNTFHIVTLGERRANQAASGMVKTFEFSPESGWTPAEFRKAVAVDPRQEFGAVETLHENTNKIIKLIEESRQNGERIIELPDYRLLPHSLRCLLLSELNSLLKTKARELGATLVGNYPELTMLRWPKL